MDCKIMVVCSPGGHFSEARDLMDDYKSDNIVYVIHYLKTVPNDFNSRVVHAPHAERDFRLIGQFIFAIKCLLREKPVAIVSTGAIIGVSFAVAAKILSIPFVYIETITRVKKPSWSGRIIYHLSDRFYIRYSEMKKYFPSAISLSNK